MDDLHALLIIISWASSTPTALQGLPVKLTTKPPCLRNLCMEVDKERTSLMCLAMSFLYSRGQ